MTVNEVPGVIQSGNVAPLQVGGVVVGVGVDAGTGVGVACGLLHGVEVIRLWQKYVPSDCFGEEVPSNNLASHTRI